MLLKKRKPRQYNDVSTVEYWRERIKPGMKLNNHVLHERSKYANFIVPPEFSIEESGSGTITIKMPKSKTQPNGAWYDIFRGGIPVEIIQEDIMSPTNPCAEISLPF